MMTDHTHAPPRAHICLIRHGETTWNTERRLQGHLDIPLNTHGLEQAHATGRYLANTDFSAIYTSDLQRAHTTATAIAQHQNAQPVPTCLTSLRERHYGVLQGLTYSDAEIQHPEIFYHFKARTPDFTFGNSGENLLDFNRRITDTLTALAARHTGKQILVVTHGGVLDIVYRLVNGIGITPPRTWPIPNAAINWIEHTDSQWHLQEWAIQTHLDQAQDELPTT